MPSKALLRPVEVLAAAQNVAGAAQAVTGGWDIAAVLARRDSFTHDHNDESQVEWFRDVTNLREVPRRVAVVGGGVVGCEATTWLHGLGAEQLTVIEPGPALLARQEPFAGEMLAKQFADLGVTVMVGTPVDEVSRPGAMDTGTGRVHGGPAQISAGGRSIEIDEIVVAAGRTPASGDIGLETVGLDVSAHGLPLPGCRRSRPGSGSRVHGPSGGVGRTHRVRRP